MTNDHFFIVGAQRSGTTYAYRILDEHPDIVMAKPEHPEPKFFMADVSKYSRQDYMERYFPAKSALRYGEKSTSYIETELAAQQIAQWFPDAPVIFFLRDPIQRAISNYHFSRKHNIETRPLRDALLADQTRATPYDKSRFSVSPFAYLERGHYIRYLRMYEQYVGRENMVILIYEEFVNQLAAIQSLYQRLGVDPTYVPQQITEHINTTDTDTQPALSPTLQKRLIEHFQESTDKLRAYLNHPLHCWA